MEFLIGSQQIVRVGTTSDGDGRLINVTLGTAAIEGRGGGWVDYGGTFSYPGVGGQTNIGFGALSSAGGGQTEGNFIDRINVLLKPFVELTGGSFSTLEGETDNRPSLRIVGTVPAGGMVVHVTVTGGTAQLGVDYTTPGNATTFEVAVPAGNYGSGTEVTIPVQTLTDAVTPEPDETVILELVPAAADDDYIIDSTRTCPGNPITSTTWTIRDAAPALQLTKTATVIDNNTPGPSAGDVIRYSFSVSNTGNQTLNNVTVSDTLPGLVFATPARSIPTLAVGATNSTTFANYATYTVTAADIANGSVVNAATAQGSTGGGTPIVSNPSSVTIPMVQSPGLSLTKTAVYDDANRGYAQVGDPIAYTFRVTNTGNVPITSISISDSMLPASLQPITCPNLNPGAPAATCSFNNTSPITYSVTQADIEAGQVINTATASGTAPSGPVTSNPSSTTTPLVQAARLALTKTAGNPSAQAAGGTIAYTFRVTNTGNVPLNTLSIIDPQLAVPATCPSGTLAVGATITCTGSHTITQAEMDAGQSVNSAQARGLTPTSVAVVSPPTSTTTRLQTVRAISVDKRVVRSTISSPTTLVYTILVTNTGTASFTSLVGIDTFPDGTTATITDRLSQTGGDSDEIFEPGEVWTYEISYPVTQAEITAGTTRVNSATFTAQTASGASATATDTAVTTILQSPSFSLAKTVDTTSTEVPATLNYTITVANTGNVPLTGITISDTLTKNAPPGSETLTVLGPAGDTGSDGALSVGETWTYTAQYEVTQDDIDYAGDIINTVRVDTAQTTPRSAQVRTALTPTERLRLDKSVDSSAISTPGPLTYTVVLYSEGTADLFDVILTDTLPDGTLLAPVPDRVSSLTGAADTDGELEVGEYWTYTIPFTVDEALFQAALASGNPLVNTVTATAEALDGNTVTAPEAAAETDVVGIPALHIEKSVDQRFIDDAGDDLTYTVTVENTGNQNLTGVTLTDAVTGGDAGKSRLRQLSPLLAETPIPMVFWMSARHGLLRSPTM